MTERAGLRAAAPRWDTGCSFFDYDLDGRLDLSSPAISHSIARRIPEPGAGGYCQWKGMPVMCGPRGLPFSQQPAVPQRGRRPLRRRVSMASGIGRRKGCYGFTAVASDFDNDGYPDSTSRATRRRACSITTSTTARSRRSACSPGVGAQRGRAGTGRHGRRRRRLRRRRQHGHRQDELQRRRAERVSQQRQRDVRGSRAAVRSGRLHAVRRAGASISRTSITTGAGTC